MAMTQNASIMFLWLQTLLEWIWNNYVNIQYKNMQIRFMMILHVCRCNSQTHPNLHYEVWSTNLSNYKPIWICQPDELVQVKSFISVFLVYRSIFSTIITIDHLHLHLQIITSNSHKVSVENSSAQWAIFS